jgi:CDP-diacylglycerol--serine O-phosphatidyltransferase
VKKIAVIPTLLTLGNAVCGFAAIICAGKIKIPLESADVDPWFAWSGWLILAAMVFDALDGYVARLSKTASPFGMQLDSLCDAISFGVAPAFLLLRLGPGPAPQPQLHQALAMIAALYVVCTILRLARFNIEATAEPSSGKRFRGLPSPGAAGCVASLAIVRGELTQRWPPMDPESMRVAFEVWAILGGLVLALLMVSRLAYPHLTKQILSGRRPFSHLIQVLVAACVIFLIRDLAIVLLFWIYALASPIRYAWLRGLHRSPLAPPSTGLEDAFPH